MFSITCRLRNHPKSITLALGQCERLSSEPHDNLILGFRGKAGFWLAQTIASFRLPDAHDQS